MYLEKRPTCITVIGWAWIIIGGLMCFSSIMVLFMSIQITQSSPDVNQSMPTIFKFLPLIAIIQICFAIIGLLAGIYFLKLKSWSRNVLEVLTWLLLLFIVSFVGYFIFQMKSMPSSHTSFGFGIIELFMIIMMLGIYGTPLGIMVKYLRGDKVKNAIIGTSEPIT